MASGGGTKSGWMRTVRSVRHELNVQRILADGSIEQSTRPGVKRLIAQTSAFDATRPCYVAALPGVHDSVLGHVAGRISGAHEGQLIVPTGTPSAICAAILGPPISELS